MKQKCSKYDLIIGGIHSGIFNSTKFIRSATYIQDDITWCVRRAEALARWKNIFYIIEDATTYTLCIVLFVLGILTVFFLTTFEEKPLDIFRCGLISFQCIIGLTTLFNPKLFIHRLLFAQYMFIGYLVIQIFNAFLVTFISRVIYGIQIKTIAAASDDGYRFAGESYIFDHLSAHNKVKSIDST